MSRRLATEHMSLRQLLSQLDKDLYELESRICPGRAVGANGFAIKRARACMREIRMRGWQGTLFDVDPATGEYLHAAKGWSARIPKS
jgi:hypothetical protein